jgi:hemerythrin-like domain-containing protein
MPTKRTPSPRSSTSRSTSATRKRAPAEGHARPAARQGEENIFEILIREHREVAALFDKLRPAIEAESTDEEECLDLFAQIDAALSPHARGEEAAVYPAFAAVEDASLTVAEANEEHALVHQLLGQLRDTDEVDEVWRARAKVLMDLVEHHVEEEEGPTFKKARKGLSKDEARALAAEYLAAKQGGDGADRQSSSREDELDDDDNDEREAPRGRHAPDSRS